MPTESEDMIYTEKRSSRSSSSTSSTKPVKTASDEINSNYVQVPNYRRMNADSRRCSDPPVPDESAIWIHDKGSSLKDKLTLREAQVPSSNGPVWSQSRLEVVLLNLNEPKSKSIDDLRETDIVDEPQPPPKITPISGVLSKSLNSVVIKPIAFKPVATNVPWDQYSPFKARSGALNCHTPPSRPIMQSNLGHGGRSPREYTRGEWMIDGGEVSLVVKQGMSSPMKTSHRMESVSRRTGQSSVTPNSDSGQDPLEMVLREREKEIVQLRLTMETNEKAIIRVYDEKQQQLIKEFQHIESSYQRKIESLRNRLFKTEQSLLLKVKELEKKNVTLESEVHFYTTRPATKTLEDSIESLQTTVDQLEAELEKKNSTLEALSQRLAEENRRVADILLENKYLRTQLEESKATTTTKEKSSCSSSSSSSSSGTGSAAGGGAGGALLCNGAAKEVTLVDEAVQTIPAAAASAAASSSVSSSNEELPLEMDQLKQTIQQLSDEFETEKEVWNQEKTKVIRYQKQLQLNYIQMCRKNKALESEVEQLTLELESRDVDFLEQQESVC